VSAAGLSGASALLLHRSELALEQPLVNANTSWQRRSVLRVELHDALGASGWGEASPLPGYSRESSSECARALEALDASALRALEAPASPRGLLEAAAAAVPEALPAARFALETALLDRLGRRTGRPLFELLREAAGVDAEPRPVPLCALLPSEPGRALELARSYLARGVCTFKLKVGPECFSPAQEQTLVTLRAAFGAQIQLRLDANRSLSRGGLSALLVRAAELGVEFLEEPVLAPEPELLASSPCPLALDESLQGLSSQALDRWLMLGSVRVLVLKPTALGGFGACLALAGAARRHGRDIVVSHALEGPIGWAACAHLALALAGRTPAGLWPLAHQRAPSPEVMGHEIAVPREPGLGARP
jgi:o-succinylbenzoate synthase